MIFEFLLIISSRNKYKVDKPESIQNYLLKYRKTPDDMFKQIGNLLEDNNKGDDNCSGSNLHVKSTHQQLQFFLQNQFLRPRDIQYNEDGGDDISSNTHYDIYHNKKFTGLINENAQSKRYLTRSPIRINESKEFGCDSNYKKILGSPNNNFNNSILAPKFHLSSKRKNSEPNKNDSEYQNSEYTAQSYKNSTS